jgi:phenylacetaldehyde dehydrogenase
VTLPHRGAQLVVGAGRTPGVPAATAEDPSTGRPLHVRLDSTTADVERALAASARAWGHGSGAWSGLAPGPRHAALLRFAAAVDSRSEAFAAAHARELGIPIDTARLFAGGLAGLVEEIAAAAAGAVAAEDLSRDGRRVQRLRLPWGPAALLPSWNAPAYLAVGKLANALAAGCPSVLKPSEHATLTTEILVDALVEAELPEGAAQVVSGDARVGQQLAADGRIRLISYTGGSAGGRAVARAAIERMPALQLELSASNPAIVLEGADLELTARELVRGQLVLNGQWCEAPRRVFVPARRHDELVSALIAGSSAVVVGDATRPGVQLGPLAYREQLERVRAQVAALAGEATATRDVPPAGFFHAPTVVSALPLDAVGQEIFGPVLTVHPYAAVADAVAAANRLDDGLAGYVFGAPREAFEVATAVHAGEVRVNGVRVLDLVPGSAQSFWGTSGLGGHGRAPVLGAHLGTRIVGEEDPALAL